MPMKNAKVLFSKLKAGTCTKAELQLIKRWLLYYQAGEPSELTDEDFVKADEDIWQMVQKGLIKETKTRKLWSPLFKIGTAAAILLFVLGIGFYSYLETGKQQTIISESSYDIKPGGNNAILTLSNGQKVNLTDVENGELVELGGIKITKVLDGQLIYTVLDTKLKSSQIAYNTIETPQGGQYQLRLPDGTNIWLNAASSLTYPTNFTDAKERRVELKGEAYFEVAHDEAIPFKVITDKQEVNVLGTHFVINAYLNEPFTRTTLLEGSVAVSKTGLHDTKVLKPGQQSLVSSDYQIQVMKANIDHEIAWKNGLFSFQNTTLYDVMNEFERWYDVKIEYRGNVPNRKFSGKIYRNINASEALQILRYAEVNYNIEKDEHREGKMKIVVSQ